MFDVMLLSGLWGLCGSESSWRFRVHWLIVTELQTLTHKAFIGSAGGGGGHLLTEQLLRG